MTPPGGVLRAFAEDVTDSRLPVSTHVAVFAEDSDLRYWTDALPAAPPVGLADVKRIITKPRDAVRRIRRRLTLPPAARDEAHGDRAGLRASDPGSAAAIAAALDWLCRAQDQSRSHDGGVAHNFSLIDGWSTSYPETTGYIVPTFLELAARSGRDDVRARARRMLEWLVSIQLENGAFQGGKLDSLPVAPVVFNTGQILLGLAAGQRAFGTFLEPMCRAADWLVSIQDADGCWRQGASPFAAAGDKAYDTHTAWGLLEAARVAPDRPYGESALRNIRWALTHQQPNGWFSRCCLSDPDRPLTHTLGYALRGVLEGWFYARDPALLAAARRTADGLLGALQPDGFLPGQLAPDWSPAADWACLTGTVQIAYCWLALHRETGDARYLNAGRVANRYVRRTMSLGGADDVRGAIKGSFPVDGGYRTWEFPNWSAKFLIDSLLLEADLEAAQSPARAAG